MQYHAILLTGDTTFGYTFNAASETVAKEVITEQFPDWHIISLKNELELYEDLERHYEGME